MSENTVKFSKSQKRKSVFRLIKSILGKFPYIVLGYFCYPFINRGKVRDKYYASGCNWYTLQLWYMINDDEWIKNGPYTDTDYNVAKVKERGIDTSTKWGEFKATYWFNAKRNPASNYMFSRKKVKTTSYDNQEVEINNIYYLKGGEVNPLDRAEWRWIRKDGVIDNVGDKISWEYSKIGEGLVWFNPNNDPDIVDFRYSNAFRKRVFGKYFFITFQCGDWGQKYDVEFKIRVV